MKYIAAIIIMFSSHSVIADSMGWDNTQGTTMDNWNRQNEINQIQLDNQRQFDQQNKQMQEMQRANEQMQQDMQRQRMIRSGQGRPNSLADELYR